MALPHFPAELRALEDFRPPPGAPEEATRLEDYADFEDILDGADGRGILDVPAEDADAARTGRANLVREAVIAERLWLLGYLADRADVASSENAAERERFLGAVAAFQQGAGLLADQWSGEKTWRALQELVTFEAPTNVGRYADGEQPRPALVRAARLRLWSLGLLGRKPAARAASEQIPAEALTKFWVLSTRFGLAGPQDPEPPVLELLERLFDQDRVLEAVARAGRRRPIRGRDRWVFSYLKRPAEKRRVTDPQVESFLACLAKIELWLLGFDVDISHNRNYPVYLFQESTRQRNRKLKKALEQFWEQLGEGEGPGDDGLSPAARRRRRADRKRLREFITPELFKALANPELSAQLADPESAAAARPLKPTKAGDYSSEVTQELKTEEEIDRTWAKGKSLGMKLWDGLRRVWRWIRRGIARILRIGLNLVRAFFRYSMKAFQIAKRVVKTVAQSLGQYIRGEIRTETRVQLLLARDGDIRATMPDNAPPEELRAAENRLRYFGTAFHMSCRILGAILRTIRMAVVGALGWARLLWMLVRSYRDIRPLYRELRALPEPQAPQAAA